MKNQIVLLLNAIVLIALGLWGYFSADPAHRSMTAFIAPAVGVILLAFYLPVTKQNKTATHIVVVLTLVAAIVFFVVGFLRGNPLIIIMAVVTLIALVFYIMDFIRRKKEREAAKV